MRRLYKKLRGRAGFTLLELMCTLLIVAMVGLAVAAGCQLAPRVYRQSMFTSESRGLEDTLRVALGDVLRAANYKETVAGEVRFSSSGYGITAGSFVLSDNKLMFFKDVSQRDTLSPVINAGMYSNIQIGEFSLAYDETTHVFSGSYTLRLGAGDSMSRSVDYAFRSVYSD